MAIVCTLTSVFLLRTGALLLLLLTIMVAPRENATSAGSDEGRGTSAADERNQQMSSVDHNLTNGSLSERPRHHHPIYLKPGNRSGMGCVELRSKRYVSDGQCTSIRPLIEVVCSGLCLPVRTLPWYADYVRAWAGTSPTEWRCVDDVVRKRKLTLLCEDGTTRSYRVKVVKNCRCKQMERHRIHTDTSATKKNGKGGGGRRRGGGARHRAENGDLERPREVNEKRRLRKKHGSTTSSP